MEDWKEKIEDFILSEVENILITDSEGRFVNNEYTADIKLSPKGIRAWGICLPEAYEGQSGEVWEFSDKENNKYYSVTTSTIQTDEGLFQLHRLVDVTNYSDLFKKISELYKEMEVLSKFQNTALKKLSDGYEMLLPDVAAILDVSEVHLRVRTNLFAEEIIYCVEGNDTRKIVHRDMNIEMGPDEGEYEGELFCLLKGNEDNYSYCVLIKRNTGTDISKIENMLIINTIHMFVVNVLLSLQIIYASEHDALTGLYNKGKFMELLERQFGNPSSIAIFNMDVNFLKKANDTYGHEKGDELIVKAAKSIQMIEDDDILGFRMGGDEYMVVVLDKTLEEVNEIKSNWEKAVIKINEDNDIIPLVIACGMTYGNGDYSLNKLIKEADERMYIDKKMKKGGRE